MSQRIGRCEAENRESLVEETMSYSNPAELLERLRVLFG